MTKFKVGDKLKCVDDKYMEHRLKSGSFYTVLGLTTIVKGTLTMTPEGEFAEFEAFPERFEHVKDNGVDAEGNPIYFSQDMLKPFMRVERKEGTFGVYVGNVNNEGDCVVGDFKNGSTWTSEFSLENKPYYEDYALTVAVYAPPRHVPDYLNVNCKGKLIWKRQEIKSPEQLAQEAARKRAIEEAEKALSVAQQNLNELKGL